MNIQGFRGKMGFHFAKQKKRILAKTSILSKIPFYPEKPSRLLENFHFALFLEFDKFFASFVLKFEQILKFQISKFHIKISDYHKKLNLVQCRYRLCNTGALLSRFRLVCLNAVRCSFRVSTL